jgi:xyloglucan:xyloglucosyl transferase
MTMYCDVDVERNPSTDLFRWLHGLFASCRFYIDETPIREVVRTESMGAQFPSKPMSLYATIWDGSSWATSGGRYKVDYKYAPYVAEFTDLALRGCAVGRTTTGDTPACAGVPDAMPPAKWSAMEAFRARYMTYGYCYDRLRYPLPLPECTVGAEAAAFLPSGDARASSRRRGGRRHRPRGGADSAL